MNETTLVKKRLVALDVFRGITIATMILVNTPGSWAHVYPPLLHSKWAGCTPTDLVFPFFLFIIGVAMWFSFRKFDHRANPAALRKLARRVLVILAIGWALNAFPYVRDYSTFRFMGVLQRIALAYGIASLLCLYLNRKKLLIVSGAILLGYWLLLWGGGGADPYGLETNLVRKIDLFVFGPKHVWHGFGIAFDPEGLLSTLPATVSILLGYFTGRIIDGEASIREAVLKLLLWGTTALAVGVVWNPVFPLIKGIWTSSYVLYTGGIAMIGLAWCLWLIDVKGIDRWSRPFQVFGMNSLFAFVLSEFWVLVIIYWVRIPTGAGETTSLYGWLYHHVFEAMAGPLNGSLLFALFHVALFWLALLPLYRKRIYIKI